MSLPSTELELLESLSQPGRAPAEAPPGWALGAIGGLSAAGIVCADLPPVAGLGEWGPAPRRSAAPQPAAGPMPPRPAWWQRLTRRLLG